ncbi:hypothetical protein FF2_030117 [Malus domestica]
MPFQQTLSSHSVFLIPWGTFANNSSKAKVFLIMKVESKSISYHAFSLFFSLSLFWDKEKESKRWPLGKTEERNRPTPLPSACPPCRRNKQRRMQTAQSNQPSRRSLI